MERFPFPQWTMVCVSAGLCLWFVGCGPKAPQAAQQKMLPEVAVVTIQQEPLVLTAELPGRTAAYRMADIRPQVNGIILKRTFEEGSFVQAGDLLYQIDPAQYQAAYDQAQAAVAMAEAGLPAIRSRAERFKELVQSRAVGQQDYDDALAALHQAEAQLAVAKAALKTAQINLSYTPIKAPIPGRIGRSSVTEGALVTAYQPVPLATIKQLDPIYVDVPQSTTEVLALQRRMEQGYFSAGDSERNKVTIIREDGTTYPLEGILEFRDVTVNPSTGSVILRIKVPNPQSALLPGMFVRAVLKEGLIEKAILVTQAGVGRTARGEPFVWVVDEEGKAQLRMITIDRAVGNRWLVSQGLAKGDRVIVEGLQRLRPGMPIRVVSFDPSHQKDPSAIKAETGRK